ncbi:hypothetical protein TUM4261_15410 [Shewanella sp. c952]|nr:hypothetical protein TUM4261_15410 [Shewanella sp. c952]
MIEIRSRSAGLSKSYSGTYGFTGGSITHCELSTVAVLASFAKTNWGSRLKARK